MVLVSSPVAAPVATPVAVVRPLAPLLSAIRKERKNPYYKRSRVTAEARKAAPYTIWIRHVDNTKNNTLIVYQWRKERDRLPCFRAAARLLRNYRGTPIKEARFYVNASGGGIWGCYRWVSGELLFTEGAEFMNRL